MIESAVMETARGRWFLAEHARRNRHADTNLLLAAIDRLESNIRGDEPARSVDRIRSDLFEMANSIARTKAEIADLKPSGAHQGKFGEATGELDSIIRATEDATSGILEAAEQVQEIAWTLREQGLAAEICDRLDSRATAIYMACSFQDLTGQRTSRVIAALRYLEGRINALIDAWGVEGTASAGADGNSSRTMASAGLPDQLAPGALDQADVDIVMAPSLNARRPPPTPRGPATGMDPERVHAEPAVKGDSPSKMRREISPAPLPGPEAIRPRGNPAPGPIGAREKIRGAGEGAHFASRPSSPEPDHGVVLLELEPDPAPAVPAADPLPAACDQGPIGAREAETTGKLQAEIPPPPATAALAGPEATFVAETNPTIVRAALDRLNALSPEEKIALFS
jgi:hypothetical protein